MFLQRSLTLKLCKILPRRRMYWMYDCEFLIFQLRRYQVERSFFLIHRMPIIDGFFMWSCLPTMHYDIYCIRL